MKTVILCGGKGTRTGHNRVKPLIEIGGKAVLWHIMKIYSHFGFNDFVLCLGHRGDEIREWAGELDEQIENGGEWKVTCLETGPETNSGGRLKKIEAHLGDAPFFVNYADVLASIDIRELLQFHEGHERVATLTAVRPRSQFGIVEMDGSGEVERFEEKPLLDRWVNGGFFVFNSEVFEYLTEEDVLERETFGRLVEADQLHGFRFEGEWICMDTYKDTLRLNELWKNGDAFWRIWR